MHTIKFSKTRLFLSFLGILLLAQCLLAIQDTRRVTKENNGSKTVLAATNPKKYFITQLAPLLSTPAVTADAEIVTKMNRVFEDLGINAYVVANTVTRQGQSVEFLVYVNKYGKVFPVRYTPLINDVAQLISEENFRLEVRAFASWMPLTIDRLLG